MIIDKILDRKDGIGEYAIYDPKVFYRDVTKYGEIGLQIAEALDSGEEIDIKKALCLYIIEQDYSLDICLYVQKVNWLDNNS